MNPTHLFLLTAISCLIFNLAQAQSPRHFIKWADESYADGDYYGAGVYYEKAMAKDSLDIQLLWKYANALRLSNQYAKAAWYYAKIYKKERGTLFPESAFWLAVMQKNTGHYRGAIKTWKKLERKYKRKKSSYYYRKAHQERASCTWANEHLTDSVPVTVRNIGKPVNSYMAEFGAYLKDSTLYFSTLRAKKYGDNREVYDTRYTTQIFQSEKKGGLYAPPKAIDTTINPTGMHVANGVFNAAGTGFYFSRCPDLKTCGIWMSKWQNGRWGQAIELEGINKPGTMTTQPMMARVNDKEYLFFASDRDGGEGKMDIWYALAKGNNQFGKPRNAGKTINSPDDEITPWYNNGKLYFSSRWHYGYGGFDIFRSDGVPGNFAPPL